MARMPKRLRLAKRKALADAKEQRIAAAERKHVARGGVYAKFDWDPHLGSRQTRRGKIHNRPKLAWQWDHRKAASVQSRGAKTIA